MSKPKFVRNKRIKVKNTSYEVFWSTEYVENHIKNSRGKYPHITNLVELESFLSSAYYYKLPSGDLWIALNEYNGKGYNAFCYLERVSKHLRLVVVTCYQISDSRTLDLWKTVKGQTLA
jgi:hypothetical protein